MEPIDTPQEILRQQMELMLMPFVLEGATLKDRSRICAALHQHPAYPEILKLYLDVDLLDRYYCTLFELLLLMRKRGGFN